MILKVPEGFPSDYYTGVSLYLWIVTIFLMFFSCVLFLLKGLKQRDLKSLKMTYFAYSFFMLMMAFTRIVFIIAVYIPRDYDFWTTLGYVTGIAGLLFWLYVMETYLVPKTKKIFFIISSIAFCTAIIALIGIIPRDLALDIQFILLPFAVVAILILHLYLIIKTTGSVRVKIIWILVGLALIMTAQLMDGQDFIAAFPSFPLAIPPLIMMAGVSIFTISQLYEKK